jgi:glycosyltransferase involved in cell wall biosynthesis
MGMSLFRLTRLAPTWLRRFVRRFFPGLVSRLKSGSLGQHIGQRPLFGVDMRSDLNRHINGNPLWLGPDGDVTVISYSPFPPSSHGIGVYASDLVGSLRKKVKVGVRVVGDSPESPILPGVYSAELGLVADRDKPVYELFHLGNGPVHLGTWKNLHQRPGVVFLHDIRIQDIPLLPLEGDYFRRMRYSHKVATHAGRIPEDVPVIVVHSEHAKRLLQDQFERARKTCPPVHVLSMGHPVKAVSEPKTYPTGKPLVGVFGFQYQSKDPLTTYRALAHLSRRVGARAVVCGRIDPRLEGKLRKIWRQGGNSDGDLEVTGEVSLESFDAWIKSVDLGIQLRTVSNGESSGPIAQLMSAGVPTLVTSLGAVVEYPDNALVKLPVGASADEVSAAAAMVLGSKPTYEALSRAGTEYFRTRTFDHAAEEILDVIREMGIARTPHS